MSNITLADLPYISRETLAAQIRAPQALTETPTNTPGLPPTLAVIDVRDSDHVGGHIRGSTWVPSSQLDYKTPELIRTLKDKDMVVFHCALSQQRGPSAALRYLREKERLEGGEGEGKSGESKEKEGKEEEEEEEGKRKQKVVVLKGGFTEWQEKFGRDSRLTEGWEKGIWEDGY
jgi:rhodanese-related sulfurtransferase